MSKKLIAYSAVVIFLAIVIGFVMPVIAETPCEGLEPEPVLAEQDDGTLLLEWRDNKIYTKGRERIPVSLPPNEYPLIFRKDTTDILQAFSI